jgi:hypothetical protein
LLADPAADDLLILFCPFPIPKKTWDHVKGFIPCLQHRIHARFLHLAIQEIHIVSLLAICGFICVI